MFSKRSILFCLTIGVLFYMTACQQKPAATKPAVAVYDLSIDTGIIPKDTVLGTAVQSTRNGWILLNNNKFSGYVATFYPNKTIRTVTGVYDGMIHGITRNYYENGSLRDVRQYKENLSTGKHFGFWPNGNKQFEYVYFQNRKIGYMNRWYENGKPYLFLNYKNDEEEGLQQGWRDNGKLFINYVAKDGYRYGLQETMLCYKLNEGNIIK